MPDGNAGTRGRNPVDRMDGGMLPVADAHQPFARFDISPISSLLKDERGGFGLVQLGLKMVDAPSLGAELVACCRHLEAFLVIGPGFLAEVIGEDGHRGQNHDVADPESEPGSAPGSDFGRLALRSAHTALYLHVPGLTRLSEPRQL